MTLTLKASYEFLDDSRGWGFLKKGSITGAIDMLGVDYHEFSDLTAGAPIGEEPLYKLEANIFQLFFSFWY